MRKRVGHRGRRKERNTIFNEEGGNFRGGVIKYRGMKTINTQKEKETPIITSIGYEKNGPKGGLGETFLFGDNIRPIKKREVNRISSNQ